MCNEDKGYENESRKLGTRWLQFTAQFTQNLGVSINLIKY